MTKQSFFAGIKADLHINYVEIKGMFVRLGLTLFRVGELSLIKKNSFKKNIKKAIW